MENVKVLNEEELEKVTGGISVLDDVGKSCELVVGDVIEITNYIMVGRYCLLKIESNGTHRFLEYSLTEKYPDKGMSFAKIPTNAKIVKVGHDDQFVKNNLVGGMVF